jgi:hypothetical protein
MNTSTGRRRRSGLGICWGAAAALALGLAVGPAVGGPPDGDGTYEDMIALFEEFLAWHDLEPTADGIPDYSPAAVKRRRGDIDRFQRRLETMGVAGWDRAKQVEYLAARSHMDRAEFILHVTQPWQRDPVFYVIPIQRIAFTDVPAQGDNLERLRARLRAVPETIAAARSNLTDVAADFAFRAIYNLSQSDGVGLGHPYRDVPPDGTIGWYADLLERVERDQPELVDDARAAGQAVREFHAWLVENEKNFTSPNGVGEKMLDWFVWHVEYLPYTSQEMLRLAHRELQRTRSFMYFEQHSNRKLPEIELPRTREEYHERLAAVDRRIKEWIHEHEIITIPDYIPDDWQEMGFNVPFTDRPQGPNFWEHVQFRDPSPDHLHAVIPGHRFDAMLERHLVGHHPIRKLGYGPRREGYAVYLEEMPIPGGLFDDQPRVRELIYVFSLWRAARTIGDIHNQRNDWTVRETHDYWLDSTPWMDEGVAHNYSYLRASPGHGLQYTIGAIEMYRLLSDRQHQLGKDFVLKEFHDDFMSKGRLPLSLIRYEMTGFDDDVNRFWARERVTDALKR